MGGKTSRSSRALQPGAAVNTALIMSVCTAGLADEETRKRKGKRKRDGPVISCGKTFLPPVSLQFIQQLSDGATSSHHLSPPLPLHSPLPPPTWPWPGRCCRVLFLDIFVRPQHKEALWWRGSVTLLLLSAAAGHFVPERGALRNSGRGRARGRARARAGGSALQPSHMVAAGLLRRRQRLPLYLWHFEMN